MAPFAPSLDSLEELSKLQSPMSPAMHSVCVCLLHAVQPCNCSSFPFLSSSDGDCVEPQDAQSPTRAEDVLLWLQAAGPPHGGWQNHSCVWTVVGRLNAGCFKLGRTVKKRESVHHQKVCCQWLSTYLVFLLHSNIVPKVWALQWLMTKQRPVQHTVSAQGQCKCIIIWFYVVLKLIITQYVSFALTKLFAFPLPRVSGFQYKK